MTREIFFPDLVRARAFLLSIPINVFRRRICIEDAPPTVIRHSGITCRVGSIEIFLSSRRGTYPYTYMYIRAGNGPRGPPARPGPAQSPACSARLIPFRGPDGPAMDFSSRACPAFKVMHVYISSQRCHCSSFWILIIMQVISIGYRNRLMSASADVWCCSLLHSLAHCLFETFLWSDLRLNTLMDIIDIENEIENMNPLAIPLMSDPQSEELNILNEKYRPNLFSR